MQTAFNASVQEKKAFVILSCSLLKTTFVPISVRVYTALIPVPEGRALSVCLGDDSKGIPISARYRRIGRTMTGTLAFQTI